MNTKTRANVFASHGDFKHTAKPATLASVLGELGLKKSDLKALQSLMRAEGKKHSLAHGR